jgi:hypothetical protein
MLSLREVACSIDLLLPEEGEVGVEQGLVDSLRRPDVETLLPEGGTRLSVGRAPSFSNFRLGSKVKRI